MLMSLPCYTHKARRISYKVTYVKYLFFERREMYVS